MDLIMTRRKNESTKNTHHHRHYSHLNSNIRYKNGGIKNVHARNAGVRRRKSRIRTILRIQHIRLALKAKEMSRPPVYEQRQIFN